MSSNPRSTKQQRPLPDPKTLVPAQPGGGSPHRLKAERVQLLLEELPGWRLSPGGGAIWRAFRFPGTASALAFTHLIAALAGESGHGPSVSLQGSRVVCRLWTQGVNGLTLQDFELARRISLQA